MQIRGPEGLPSRPAGFRGAVSKGGAELEAVAQVVPAAAPSEVGARHLGGGRAAGAEGQRPRGAGLGDGVGDGGRSQGVDEGGLPGPWGEKGVSRLAAEGGLFLATG